MKNEIKSRPQSKNIKKDSYTVKKINESQAQDIFKKGKIQQEQKQFQNAIDLYQRALFNDPTYFQAYCNIGSCYRALGRYVEAKKAYLKAIGIKQDDAISHYNLANLYRIIGDYEQSIQHYTYVLELKEKKGFDIGSVYLNSLVNIGICFKNVRDYEQAIQYYEKASIIDSQDQGGPFNHAMCLMAVLEKKNIQNFHEVAKERIEKARTLFSRTIKLNPNNFMAKMSLIRLSYIYERKEQDLKRAVEQYKQLLNDSNCDLSNEVNEQIGYCLNLLKQYEQSVKYYQTSMKNLTERSAKNQAVNLYDKSHDIFEDYISQTNILGREPSQNAIFTEKQVIEMIEKGQFHLVQSKIQKINSKNLLKYTLTIILYLKLGEEARSYNQRAFEIYRNNFFINGQEVSYNKISLEGHRAIGKLLTIQNLFQEAIKHYEYISFQLKQGNNGRNQTSQLHSSLGEGYEAVGLKNRALEQYQAALELEPENYSYVYNIACFLYQNGDMVESIKHFEKFISLVQNSQELDNYNRSLYLIDCQLTMALCSNKKQNQLERFEKAFQKLINFEQENNKAIHLQIQQSTLLSFYLRMTDLQQQKLRELKKHTEQYKLTKEKLIHVYQNLLELQNCPDRNVILINCGNLYYQENLYLNAIRNYSQIEHLQKIPHENMALAYLHIFEHTMATKHIYLAMEQDPYDPIVKFNFETFNWIYALNNQGRLNKKYPNAHQNMLFYRIQYGLGLFDKLTLALQKIPDDLTFQQIDQFIDKLIENDKSILFEKSDENVKFDEISKHIKQFNPSNENPLKHHLSEDLLKLCFNRSNNVKEDLLKIIELLKQIPNNTKQLSIIQVAFYLFIYNNQLEGYAIHQIMHQLARTNIFQTEITLNVLRIPQEELISIDASFQNIKQLILTFKQWQCILEAKIVSIIKSIEPLYYRTDIQSPWEVEYHFPRHYNLKECNQTFNKIVSIIFKTLKIDLRVTCKGSNIREMKDYIIKQFQLDFNNRIKTQNIDPITLNIYFLPITIYTFHKNKQSCQNFLNQLGKMNNPPIIISIPQICEEICLIINRLVRFRCQWNSSSDHTGTIRLTLQNICENPLYIVNQAIISLQSLVDIITEQSVNGSKYLEKDKKFTIS